MKNLKRCLALLMALLIAGLTGYAEEDVLAPAAEPAEIAEEHGEVSDEPEDAAEAEEPLAESEVSDAAVEMTNAPEDVPEEPVPASAACDRNGHQWDWDKAYPVSGGTQHYYLCLVCGAKGEYEDHWTSCDRPGVCFMCGVAFDGLPQHVYNSDMWTSMDQYQHMRKCVQCGLETWETHYAYCSKAGVCARCGAKHAVDVYHDYNYEDWKPYDKNQHVLTCRACGQKMYESHYSYCTDKGICRVCGGSTSVAPQHNYDFDHLKSDAQGHGHVCADCGARLSWSGHSTACNSSNPKLCSECGYNYGGGAVTHRYDGASWSSNASGHSRNCSSCGAKQEEPHFKYCYESSSKRCSECGYALSGSVGLRHYYVNGACMFCDDNLFAVSCLSTMTLGVGESATLTVSATHDSAYTYTTSNSKVATVSAAGKITAKKAGTAVITVVGKTSGTQASCTVTVKAAPSKLAVTPAKLSLKIGETGQLSGSVTAGFSNSALAYKTSKAAVATVNANGLVTAVGEGTATITVSAYNGKKATATVTVVDPTRPTSVGLDKSGTVSQDIDRTLKLNATLAPLTAQSGLTWKSSSTKIAKVDANGVVTPVAEGTATITVTTVKKNTKGKTMSASVKVKVVDPYKPASVALDKSGTVQLAIDKTLKLNAALAPATAQSGLTWKSSSTKIAKVDANGVVTPVKEGTVTITVTTVKKNAKGKTMSASVKVKVVDPYKATGVKLDRSGTVSMKVGVTLKLNATLTPTTAVSALTWTSSDKKVLAVDSSGVLTAIKKGSATVTVKTANGKKATVKVKVS